MNTAMPKFQTRIMMSVSLMSGLLLSSCVLPPRQAWQRMKEDGVMRALFMPRRQQPVDQSSQLARGQGAARSPVGGEVTRQTQTVSKVPMAETFPGRPGFVYSPRTTPKKLVNVKGFAAGEQVLCPYTMEPFIVPNDGQNGSALARSTPAPLPTPKVNPASAGGGAGVPSVATNNPAVVELVSSDPSTPLLPDPPPGPQFGSWVEGKPGFVYSPYAARHQLVDVAGIGPGVEVKCPYSGRIFRVPELTVTETVTPLQIPPLPEMVASPAPSGTTTPSSAPEPSTPTPPLSIPKEGEKVDLTPSAPTPAPTNPAPQTSSTPPTEAPLPTAQWVEGQLDLVQSPYGQPGELVDVAGRSTGEKVICPYSGKAFLVPAKTQ